MTGDDAPRETPCAPPALPGWLAAELAGYRWLRDNVGESGGSVFRLRAKADGPGLYCKHGAGHVAQDVVDEMARLRWLAGRVPVPTVTHFLAAGDDAWLVTTALPGQTAYQLLEAEPQAAGRIVDALARFLLQLHAIDVNSCPFASDHLRRMELARVRVEAGLVEENDFDDARAGWTGGQVFDALDALLPLMPDPVVTHGDFSLDNLLLQDGEVVGCIDTGRVGVADRYQDLAIMWNCLGELGEPAQQRFLASYGLSQLDQVKLDFHLMLDELF